MLSALVMLALVVAGVLAVVTSVVHRLARDRSRQGKRVVQEGFASNDDWLEEHRKRVACFPAAVREAHKHSSNHRAEILASTICGCFYCGAIFSPTQIVEWVDPSEDENDPGTTALCPKCGIDSVIGNRSGFTPNSGFLDQLNKYWF